MPLTVGKAMPINQADLIRSDWVLPRMPGKEEITRRSRAEGKVADVWEIRRIREQSISVRGNH